MPQWAARTMAASGDPVDWFGWIDQGADSVN
jgi:hypothetical protein